MSIPRPMLYIGLALMLVFAYAGSFLGTPIWDDYHFIFWSYWQRPNPSHQSFWAYHIWPLFDSITAILYSWWKDNTLYWHLLNFSLHIINGLMIGVLVKKWRKDWALPLMLLFWIHPLNVLSVAWIMQLKTLLCAFFFLLSIFALRAWIKHDHKKWYALALFCFFLSITAKSASLPMPWIALFFLLTKKHSKKWFIAVTPFLLLTLWSTWRIATNDSVKQAVNESHVTVSEVIKAPAPAVVADEAKPAHVPVPEPLPEPIDEPLPEPIPEIVPEKTPDLKPMTALIVAPDVKIDPPKEKSTLLGFILNSLGTYLAMPWAPYSPTPVHGVYRGGVTVWAAVGLVITLLTLIIGRIKRSWLPAKLLIVQAAILFPYLGFIIVPYMTYTSVSEQHFYFVLPFTLALQLWLLDYCKQWRTPLLILICGLFLGITADYNQSFKNERVFYERILRIAPYDTIATINLAGYYHINSMNNVAVRMLGNYLKEAEKNPSLQNDPLYPTAVEAHQRYQAMNF